MNAYILAGGKSSRMGEDKGLMSINGRRIVEYVAKTYEKIADEVILVSNDPRYHTLGYAVINDIYFEKGPIGGLYAALNCDNNKEIIIGACDIPLIKEVVLKELIQAYNNHTIVCSYQSKIQPLVGIYQKNLLQIVENRIKCDHLKMMDLLSEVESDAIEIKNLFNFNPFFNCNSREDIEKINEIIKNDLKSIW